MTTLTALSGGEERRAEVDEHSPGTEGSGGRVGPTLRSKLLPAFLFPLKLWGLKLEGNRALQQGYKVIVEIGLVLHQVLLATWVLSGAPSSVY